MSAVILNGGGRFVLLDKPAAFPFKDIVTGTPEGPVFDLSVDFEGFDGVGYIKAEHVIEMAHTLGMSTKEETDSLHARIAELEEANSLIPDNVEELTNGISDLVAKWSIGVVTTDAAATYLGISLDSKESNPDDRPGKTEESGDPGKPESSPEGSSGTPDISAVKAKHPSVGKGSNKFSAGPTDGFGFDS